MTRDSLVWWFGIVAAIVMGLSTLVTGDPTNPLSLGFYGIPDAWAPQIRLLSFVIGILSAKMANSPLEDSEEKQARRDDQAMRRRRPRGPSAREIGSVVLLAAALGAAGCAGHAKARHVAVQGSVGLHAAIAAIDDTEAALFSSGVITPVEHRKLNPQIVLLLKAGRAANAAVKAWPAGAPVPGELLDAVMQLGVVADSIAAALADGRAKTQLQERIAIAKAAVSALLALSPLITGGTDGPAQGTALHGTGRQGHLDWDRDSHAAPRLAFAGR